MSDTTTDDTVLVSAAKRGDFDALEALIRRHTDAVYAHAFRFFGDPSTAEDVVQEAFLKVVRSLNGFDERARFSTWLYRIVRNTCLDMVRAGRRCPIPLDPFSVTAPDPDDVGTSAALSISVETAMRALATEDRDALSAVAVFGLSCAEAAEVLGIPAATVKSRVFRARKSLSATLALEGRSRDGVH